MFLSQMPERDSLVRGLRRGTRIDGVLGNVAEAPQKTSHRATRSVSRSQQRRHCAVKEIEGQGKHKLDSPTTFKSCDHHYCVLTLENKKSLSVSAFIV